MASASLEARLEAVFRRIQQERMGDVPILNPALEVSAVGFRDWRGRRVGVLITPWFMNIMLFPAPQEDWGSLRVGDKFVHGFPSGGYEFIAAGEPGIGPYQSCSLFSPVLEFTDHAVAVATAAAAMEALFSPGEEPAGSALLAGGGSEVEETKSRSIDPAAGNDERLLSRRALLRGGCARTPRR